MNLTYISYHNSKLQIVLSFSICSLTALHERMLFSASDLIKFMICRIWTCSCYFSWCFSYLNWCSCFCTYGFWRWSLVSHSTWFLHSECNVNFSFIILWFWFLGIMCMDGCSLNMSIFPDINELYFRSFFWITVNFLSRSYLTRDIELSRPPSSSKLCPNYVGVS